MFFEKWSVPSMRLKLVISNKKLIKNFQKKFLPEVLPCGLRASP